MSKPEPPLNVVSLAQELVRIASVNPMGDPARQGGIYGEGALTDYLNGLCQARGMQTESYEVLAGRHNLLAALPDDASPGDSTCVESSPGVAAELILLEVHQDTVPVEGMTVEPFGGQIRDGRLYGRGACDVKGGMAAMIAAVDRVGRAGRDQPLGSRPRRVVLAFTVNEESGFDGAKALRQLWESGESQLLPRPPDAIIVAEPTDLDVVTSHKGTVRWQCTTTGRAAHSSQPQRGVNAVYRMARVLLALQQYAEQQVGQLAEHPLLGRPTLSVGTIRGGLSVNTVPQRCVIEIDRRVLPGEEPIAARRHVIEYLAQALPAFGIAHADPMLVAGGLEDRTNEPLSKGLQHAARRHGAAGRIRGVPFGTDASTLAVGGVPAVVFGPGSIEQAHTADEWIDILSLQQAVEILVDFLTTR